MNTIPSTTTGPGPLSEPPFAATPLTVSNGRAVLNSHRTFPSVVPYARITPVVVPEKTAPGITVIAADCACEHGRPLQSIGGGVTRHFSSPVARLIAASAPAFAPSCESADAK